MVEQSSTRVIQIREHLSPDLLYKFVFICRLFSVTQLGFTGQFLHMGTTIGPQLHTLGRLAQQSTFALTTRARIGPFGPVVYEKQQSTIVRATATQIGLFGTTIYICADHICSNWAVLALLCNRDNNQCLRGSHPHKVGLLGWHNKRHLRRPHVAYTNWAV